MQDTCKTSGAELRTKPRVAGVDVQVFIGNNTNYNPIQATITTRIHTEHDTK